MNIPANFHSELMIRFFYENYANILNRIFCDLSSKNVKWFSVYWNRVDFDRLILGSCEIVWDLESNYISYDPMNRIISQWNQHMSQNTGR
jgi:hypothetical protein